MKVSEGKWPKGIIASDEEYAKVAYLYTKIVTSRSKNTNVALSMAMQVPVSTVKERIRTCRERGLITSPGKGKRGVLTIKACNLLGDN